MAINLNLKTYGDQFRAFVNFANANANNADTLACIEGDEPGGLLDPDGKGSRARTKTPLRRWGSTALAKASR